MAESKEKIQITVKSATVEALRLAAEKNGLSKGEVIDNLIEKNLDDDPWTASMLATTHFRILTSNMSRENLEKAAFYTAIDLMAICQDDEMLSEDEAKLRQLLEVAAKKAAQYKEQEENS